MLWLVIYSFLFCIGLFLFWYLDGCFYHIMRYKVMMMSFSHFMSGKSDLDLVRLLIDYALSNRPFLFLPYPRNTLRCFFCNSSRGQDPAVAIFIRNKNSFFVVDEKLDVGTYSTARSRSCPSPYLSWSMKTWRLAHLTAVGISSKPTTIPRPPVLGLGMFPIMTRVIKPLWC